MKIVKKIVAVLLVVAIVLSTIAAAIAAAAAEPPAYNDKVFIGDSRTVGIADATGGTNYSGVAHDADGDWAWTAGSNDTGYYYAKVNRRYDWFEGAYENYKKAISADSRVVILMGVNDCQNRFVNDPTDETAVKKYLINTADKYAVLTKKLQKETDALVYFASILPVNETKLHTWRPELKQEYIDIMNNELKKQFDGSYVQFIDITSAVPDTYNGTQKDGLHYTDETYLKIHGTILNKIIPSALNSCNLMYRNGKKCLIKNGEVVRTYTGFASDSDGTWYVKKGVVDTSYTGFVKNSKGNWYYVINGKAALDKTGFVKNQKGKLCYIKKGKFQNGVTGLVKKSKEIWYYVKNGMVANVTGFAKNDYGTWYVVNGKIAFSYTGNVKNSRGILWYVKNGKAIHRV